MIKTLITAFVIACGVLAYIWRKLPKKKERLKKKELETQIMQMEEKSKKFGVPVDNLKRDELNAKIKEIESGYVDECISAFIFISLLLDFTISQVFEIFNYKIKNCNYVF